MPGLFGGLLIALVVGVVFVNGWTDAPNAIASAVATGAVSYRGAVRLAAVCNLLGILVMSLVNASVASTITDLIGLEGLPVRAASAALCAAMAAIVLFAVTAWYFGIPTSESHALIAALTGASVALAGWGGVRPGPWAKVLVGLALSLVCGFLLGLVAARRLRPLLTRLSPRSLDRMQLLSAGGMAFMHGAQDGQKFLAVFVLADRLFRGGAADSPVVIRDHLLALLLIALVMALGTRVGGRRIIQSVGIDMVPLEKYQGVCADLGGIVCLLLASFSGVPMSTTHTKSTAIMGAGAAAGRGRLDRRIVGNMLVAWAVTFPVCGAIGFGLTKLLLRL